MTFAAAPARRPPSLLLPTLLTLAMLAALIGLGTWQLQRLAWKQSLIAAVSERTKQAPVEAPLAAEWPRLVSDALEYRHVRVTGRFDHAAEVQVFTDLPDPKGKAGGLGYWVVTPLRRDDGSVILINRGFVPQDRRDPGSRSEGQVEGPVTVAGLARWSEGRNAFTPDDNPQKGDWFTRDVRAIAAARNLTQVAPFFIDAEASAPGGLPQGGETRLVFPNRHLEYALTWYGLAIALAGVYLVFAWRRRAGRQPGLEKA